MNTRLTGAALALALGALLSACSGSAADSGTGTGQDDVASLVSAAPPQASTPPAATAERPLVRTDTSVEEEERMWATWQECLADNGGPSKASLADKRNADLGLDAKAKKAEAACANKRPEKVWERAKRLDPAYADKLRDWVTCIRSHGIDAWESDGFLAFESLPPENQMKKVDECQNKAFGAGR
jgi:hypothetical protein